MRHVLRLKRTKPTVSDRLAQSDVPAVEPALLHEFFERQVVLRPEHPAIECNGQSMT
jgi:hypothetical protein